MEPGSEPHLAEATAPWQIAAMNDFWILIVAAFGVALPLVAAGAPPDDPSGAAEELEVRILAAIERSADICGNEAPFCAASLRAAMTAGWSVDGWSVGDLDGDGVSERVASVCSPDGVRAWILEIGSALEVRSEGQCDGAHGAPAMEPLVAGHLVATSHHPTGASTVERIAVRQGAAAIVRRTHNSRYGTTDWDYDALVRVDDPGDETIGVVRTALVPVRVASSDRLAPTAFVVSGAEHWTGADDAHAVVWGAVDGEDLILTVEVTDDAHVDADHVALWWHTADVAAHHLSVARDGSAQWTQPPRPTEPVPTVTRTSTGWSLRFSGANQSLHAHRVAVALTDVDATGGPATLVATTDRWDEDAGGQLIVGWPQPRGRRAADWADVAAALPEL